MTLFLTLLILLATTIHAEQCFLPNGTPVEDERIIPYGSDPVCGWPGDQCWENGFCFSIHWGRVYRGFCTDPNWASAGCATECLSTNSSAVTRCKSGLLCCGFGDADATKLCCQQNAGFNWTLTSEATFSHEDTSTPSTSTSLTSNSTESPSAPDSSTSIRSSSNQQQDRLRTLVPSIVVPVVVLLSLVGLIWFCRRRRRSRLSASISSLSTALQHLAPNNDTRSPGAHDATNTNLGDRPTYSKNQASGNSRNQYGNSSNTNITNHGPFYYGGSTASGNLMPNVTGLIDLSE